MNTSHTLRPFYKLIIAQLVNCQLNAVNTCQQPRTWQDQTGNWGMFNLLRIKSFTKGRWGNRDRCTNEHHVQSKMYTPVQEFAAASHTKGRWIESEGLFRKHTPGLYHIWAPRVWQHFTYIRIVTSVQPARDRSDLENSIRILARKLPKCSIYA